VNPKKDWKSHIKQRVVRLHERAEQSLEQVRTRLLILSTPRSGSSLFCDVLNQSGQTGWALEWFHPLLLEAQAELLGTQQLNFSDYFKTLLCKTVSPQGVFSFKLHIDHYQSLKDQGVDFTQFKFDRVYYIFRQQKLEQAHSFAKALQTRQWRHNYSADKTGVTVTPEQMLQALYSLNHNEDLYQRDWRGRVDREFFYEDFSQLQQTTAFNQVFEDLGLSPPTEGWATKLQKQRNEQDVHELARIRQYLMP